MAQNSLIDIIYPTYNRLEFTKRSLQAMIANTDWSLVRRFIIYDDGSTDGTTEYLKTLEFPKNPEFVFQKLGGPVAVMVHYLKGKPSDIFCKIDNDVMLPRYWLNESLKVILKHSELDILGIDTFNPVQPGICKRGYRKCSHIGGVGLMRKSCFRTLPRPNGRHGFYQWQLQSHVTKGWIDPAMQVFTLDKMYIEPWVSLSKKYIENHWQRYWAPYTPAESFLWEWI